MPGLVVVVLSIRLFLHTIAISRGVAREGEIVGDPTKSTGGQFGISGKLYTRLILPFYSSKLTGYASISGTSPSVESGVHQSSPRHGDDPSLVASFVFTGERVGDDQ